MDLVRKSSFIVELSLVDFWLVKLIPVYVRLSVVMLFVFLSVKVLSEMVESVLGTVSFDGSIEEADDKEGFVAEKYDIKIFNKSIYFLSSNGIWIWTCYQNN